MKCDNKSGRKNKVYGFLYKDVNEFNKIYLSLFSALFIFFCGLISYFMTNSFAWFTYVLSSDENINLVVDTCKREKIYEFDKSNANAPILSENMIPVYYDECDEVWKKADSSNTSSLYKWYNYDEKIWANSVTVTSSSRSSYKKAPLGTEIKMDDILTMQVWIPRYKYKVWNYNLDGTVASEPQEINIVFEEGISSTGDIECVDDVKGTSDGTINGAEQLYSEVCKLKSNNANCTDNLCTDKMYTHPAFTFGDEELEGFWVGKFEVSSDISCTPASVGCNLTTIRPLVKPNVGSWRGAVPGVYQNNLMAMNDSGNKYGFSTLDDTHMIKNMEWGAIAYLSHSKYGINKEILANRNSKLLTGCGPISLDSTSTGEICNSYNTSLGQTASTTGNIYGIYDMVGSTYDFVMGNMISPNGVDMLTGRDAVENSGYTGIIVNNYVSYVGPLGNYPNDKYYDKYTFSADNEAKHRSKLGDATREMYKELGYISWYEDRCTLVTPDDNGPWVIRGGRYSSSTSPGIFYANSVVGVQGSDASTMMIIS